ncbi:MAG: alpha,alpha-trehalase TreF [Aurantibacter sp.]
MKYLGFFIAVLFLSCKTDKKAESPATVIETVSTETQSLKTPDELLGELFTDVQLGQVFEDGKTFVDCTAKYPYNTIKEKYQAQKDASDFELKVFVLENFEVPPSITSDFKSDPNRSAKEHVEVLWPELQRKSDVNKSGSTLIPLPEPYVVPGGRFREVYYWDSYFTMLGLVESGKFDLIANMLDNFAHLINEVGHIPNGNRTYYITRSQPPFFAQMVALLAEHKGEEVYDTYKEALKKEYEFWMEGQAATDRPIKHCVNTPSGIMNRYYDLGDSPRQESYREDYTLVGKTKGGGKMYRDLRSGAESGWDYSTRWFADGKTMETIETTDIIPVDLNALMYGLEEVLTKCYKDDDAFVAAMKTSMEARKDFLNTYGWNESDKIFEDYNWAKQKQTGVKSLAMVYPLFFEMASQEQADGVATYLKAHFLKPGGLPATLNHSGQQWDAPNGWAPLQWMAIIGLENYGHSDLAKTVAERWVSLNEKVYANTGKFVEKYNVEDMTLDAGGGEYPVQDGFGWSNGVYLALKAHLDKD